MFPFSLEPFWWQERTKWIIHTYSSSSHRITSGTDGKWISDLLNYTLRQLIFFPSVNSIIVSIQLLFPLLMNFIRPKFQLFACSEHLPSLRSQHFLIDFHNLLFSSSHLFFRNMLKSQSNYFLSLEDGSLHQDELIEADFITVYLLLLNFWLHNQQNSTECQILVSSYWWCQDRPNFFCVFFIFYTGSHYVLLCFCVDAGWSAGQSGP